MDGKRDQQPVPGSEHRPPFVRPESHPVQRFDTRTGRPLAVDGAPVPMPVPGERPFPVRRRTFVRDLVLVSLHLAVYVVVIGGIVFFIGGFGAGPIGLGYDSFDAIFWPSYVWGTLIAAQAGATVFQRRRFMGVVLGAMASVLLGTWVLDQIVEYQVTAIVFRSVAVALIALALAVSLLRRPPAFMLAEVTVAAPRQSEGPVLASSRRSGPGTFPNVLLGLIALVFVLAGIANGTYRALEVRGSGEPGRREVSVPPFDGISVSGPGELLIVSGAEPTLTISGDDNLLDSVDVANRDGELTIDFDPAARGRTRFERPLRYVVTAPALGALTLGGHVQATIDPSVAVSSLRVVAEDDATLTIDGLDGMALSAAVRDQATVILSGQTGSLAIAADDDAVVDAQALSVTEASVTAWSSASVSLGETGTLTYQQAGVARIACVPGTEVLPGSTGQTPQCVDPDGVDRIDRPYDDSTQ